MGGSHLLYFYSISEWFGVSLEVKNCLYKMMLITTCSSQRFLCCVLKGQFLEGEVGM